MLTVADVEETVRFYSDKLGFSQTGSSRDSSWAEVQRDGIAVMFALPNLHMPRWDKPVFTGSFYFLTDNVDEVWNAVKDELKVCYPLSDFDYGMREFAVFDNNGYLIQFGQELKTEALMVDL
jgi:uncharacterized glyoxalase superfamily protein PhnB